MAEELHIRHVGEIVHAWSQAHGALFHIFSLLTFDADIFTAHKLWHSTQSDKAQRAMLEAIVKAKPNNLSKSHCNAILWALSAMDALSPYRNDAVHVEIIAGHPEIIAAMSAKDASQERLEKYPIAKHWKSFCGDMNAVINYLDAVYVALWQHLPRPLSHRPKLRLALITSAKKQRARRLAKKHARNNQRQSSRNSGGNSGGTPVTGASSPK
jgi:hypothetical protein